jgi:hypothetical protein
MQAGASWFGAMDMSGNVWEQCIGGRGFDYSGFTAANGDGSIHWSGSATVGGWPLNGGGENGGAIIRGGGCAEGPNQIRVSDRWGILNNANQGRVWTIGGRGVRSHTF